MHFLLIGGVAGRLWGSPSLTNDTDVCYAPDPDNLERLAGALRGLDADLRDVDDDRAVHARSEDPRELAGVHVHDERGCARPARGTRGHQRLRRVDGERRALRSGRGARRRRLLAGRPHSDEARGRATQGSHRRSRCSLLCARSATPSSDGRARIAVRLTAMREAIAGRFVGDQGGAGRGPAAAHRARVATSTTSTVPACCTRTFVRSPHPHALDPRDRRRRRAASPRRGRGLHRRRHRGAHQPVPRASLPLPGLYSPLHFALAIDRVRVVGDPVAHGRGRRRATSAEDAAELVDVDYEELAPIATIDARARSVAPADLARRPRQRAARRPRRVRRRRRRVRGAPTASCRERFVQHRHSNQPMETRGCVAEVDPARGHGAPTTRPRRTRTCLKWSLGRAHRSATGRGASLVEIVASAGRWPSWRKRAKALRPANRPRRDRRRRPKRRHRRRRPARLKPIGAGLAGHADGCRPFLREPRRIVHLVRIVARAPRPGPGHAAARHARRTSAARSASRRS